MKMEKLSVKFCYKFIYTFINYIALCIIKKRRGNEKENDEDSYQHACVKTRHEREYITFILLCLREMISVERRK